MKIKIHFAVGGTAMTTELEINETFREFCDVLELSRKDDEIVRFTGAVGLAVVARNIVLVEVLS